MDYENKVVLFLDILGFKKIIERTMDGTEQNDEKGRDGVGDLYAILNEMGRIATNSSVDSDSVNVTQFSDSIIISFDTKNSSEGVRTIDVIMRIIIHLISNDILCRGAISFGKFVHDKNILFGPALIDAYETESKAALYPRVVMDRDFYNLIRMYIDKSGKGIILPKEGIYIKRDLDTKYYADYFQGAIYLIEDDALLEKYFRKLREIIVSGSYFRQPDLRVKYGWMKVKFNALIGYFRDESEKSSLNLPLTKKYFQGIKSFKY